MSTAAYAIRQKTETALQAYLAARLASAGTTALTGVDIRLRQEVTNRAFPRVIIEAQRSPAMEEDYDIYMIDLMVALATLADETDSAARHAARVGLLTEWLADREAVKAYINSGLRPWITPAVPAVPVPVTDLRVYDIIPEDEQAEQTGQHWLDALSYAVPAQLVSS